jgi:hypothetical protein
VDNCDGWASAEHNSSDPIGETFAKMQADAQRWNNLNNIPVDYATNEKLILHDNKGGIAVIDFAAPDQPNKMTSLLLVFRRKPGPPLQRIGQVNKRAVCHSYIRSPLCPRSEASALATSPPEA